MAYQAMMNNPALRKQVKDLKKKKDETKEEKKERKRREKEVSLARDDLEVRCRSDVLVHLRRRN
jgi:hypothetical protein